MTPSALWPELEAAPETRVDLVAGLWGFMVRGRRHEYSIGCFDDYSCFVIIFGSSPPSFCFYVSSPLVSPSSSSLSCILLYRHHQHHRFRQNTQLSLFIPSFSSSFLFFVSLSVSSLSSTSSASTFHRIENLYIQSVSPLFLCFYSHRLSAFFYALFISIFLFDPRFGSRTYQKAKSFASSLLLDHHTAPCSAFRLSIPSLPPFSFSLHYTYSFRFAPPLCTSSFIPFPSRFSLSLPPLFFLLAQTQKTKKKRLFSCKW
jgi:hypothetical protein